jgi:2-phosphoglycolate phosphatase
MDVAPPYRLVIFDLDGTLADTSEDIAASMTRTLTSLGLPAPPAREIIDGVGWGAEVLSRAVLDPADLPRAGEVLAAFRADYHDQLAVNTRLYPGIRELLVALRGAGIAIAVATNKPGDLTREVLRQLQVFALFDHVVGPEDVTHKKPAPDAIEELCRRCEVPASATAMVGDMETDIDAARAAGVTAVLLTFSDFRRDAELPARADVVLDSVEALGRLLLPAGTVPQRL